MAKARNTDPQTSHEAAASVDNIKQTQFMIWHLLEIPKHDVDLIKSYRAYPNIPQPSESGIRSRRAELVARGMVKDTGHRVKLPSGRRAIVWQRVEPAGL